MVDPATRCSLCHHREDEHETLPDGTRPCRSIGHEKGLTCRECMRLTGAEHVEAVMALRGADDEAFEVAWAAYYATLQHVRKEIGSGWQAFFTDVHQAALASAVLTLRTYRPAPHAERRNRFAKAIYEYWNTDHPWSDAHPDDVIAYGVEADAAMKAADEVGGPFASPLRADAYREVADRISLYAVLERAREDGIAGVADKVREWAGQIVECAGCGDTGACAGDPCAHPASTAPLAVGLPVVKGNCPACGGATLFLGDGGYVTCSRADCGEPDAASTLLEA